jgi:tetratricopeptide (TPR) repeat protein
MSRSVVIATALALIACTKKAPPVVDSDAGGAAASTVTSAQPPSPRKRPVTTSWGIAGDNLDGEIATRLSRDLSKPKEALAAVQLLLARGQFVSRIADYEKADDIAQRVASTNPGSADALRARASVHGVFHRWDAARRDLDEAQKLGASADSLEGARGSIAMARGEYDEATKYIREDTPNASDLATAAVLAGLRQKHGDAQRMFDKARATYGDVAPFPIAWMAFERARWLEARGKTEQAREWYEEALDVIPVYAHAAVHLAANDPPDKAIARLDPLTKTSDDPDVLAALADAHQRAKHDDDAKKWSAAARARYDELVKRHPEAFADHAARFFLKQGEAKRSLELAQQNAKNRATEEALDLLLGAATAANAKDAMCDAALKMNALVYVSPDRKRLASATLGSCAP